MNDSTGEHWIQHITFAVKTNGADTHTQRDGRRATQYLLRSLSDGEGYYLAKLMYSVCTGESFITKVFYCHRFLLHFTILHISAIIAFHFY